MSRVGDYLLGIAEDVQHVLEALGHDVDEGEFDSINATVCLGDPGELEQLEGYIAWTAQNAEKTVRFPAIAAACLVVMELDELASARREPVAA